MNGLLGAQLGAQSGMTNGGVMGYADLIRKKLMETIAPKSAEVLKEETPQPTAQKDYTAGLTPPEIGGVPSKLEFKATPNRLSAFMVALGQIMQNKYNTDRLKEEQAQGIYETKLKSGQQMNQFQSELGMKEAAEARDPYRQAQIEKAKNDIAMSPIEMKIKEASLANLLKRGERIGKTKGDSDTGGAITRTQLLSPEDQKIYNGLQTKAQRDKFFMEKVNPNTLKTKQAELNIEKTVLANRLAKMEIEYRTETDPVKKEKLHNDIIQDNMRLVKTQQDMDIANELMGGIAPIKTPEQIKKDYVPNPQPKPPVQAPQSETKVINGVTYQKINGGWQKIK